MGIRIFDWVDDKDYVHRLRGGQSEMGIKGVWRLTFTTKGEPSGGMKQR